MSEEAHIVIEVNGLADVVAATTEIASVDGVRGQLVYRGHAANELALRHSFEDVAALLWTGTGAGRCEPCGDPEIGAKLQRLRSVDDWVLEVVDRLPSSADLMSVLRTAVSALGVHSDWPPTLEQALSLTAKVPTLITYRWARQRGIHPTSPNPHLPHVANYLYMVHDGRKASPAHVRALQAYMILAMEHGMNASTFAARVVTSTQSDLASALTAAIGAMKGPLHGGAPSEVMTMLEDIGTPDRARPWLRTQLEQGKRLMGFGHRIYKTEDPRAVALREVVSRLRQDDPWFTLALQVEADAVDLLAEFKPGRRLYANVEFWAACILRAVGIPKELYTPTFTTSRMVGWTAHVLEQAACNRLIRPQSVYAGPLPPETT